MRLKLVPFFLIAGTVVGCASNPPPPPPMAMAPEPAPVAPPPPAMAMAGVYRGTAELAADAPRRCRRMTAAQTARVRGTTITVNGMTGKINPDGSVTMAARRGMSLTGTVNGGSADLMSTRGGCTYHYTLTHA